MSVWRSVRLGDVIDIFDHKRVPLSSAQRADRKGPFPYYGAQGVIDHIDAFIFDGRYVLIPEDGENLRSRKLPIAYFAEGKFWVNNHAHIVKAKPGVAVDRFVQSAVEATDIGSWVTGAAQPKLSQANLRQIPIRIPAYRDQQTISSVLDALDDLIDKNRRRGEVLEEMARAIYREWFVHFRFPGRGATQFAESTSGVVPKGWIVKTVADLSSAVTRGVAPKYAEDGSWVAINQKCIRDERVSLGPARRQERAVPEAKCVRFGDVLINSTGVGTLGRVALYRGDVKHITVDTHVTIARPSDESLNPWFGMALMSRKAEFERLGSGSTGQTELSRSDVGALRLALPPGDLRSRFSGSVWPLLAEADALLRWNVTLAEIRDMLLPKLITGKIDLSRLDVDVRTEDSVI